MSQDETLAGVVEGDVFPGGGEIAAIMRELDWSATPLGPPETWPKSLRSVVRIMLTSGYQMWLGWGPQLAFLYNDAYRPTMGVKHPHGLGQPAPEVWREIWHDIGPLIDDVMATGEATFREGMLLLLERSGFAEETYHTFSYSPLFDDSGAVSGLFCVVMEETERVINDRRLGTLRALSSSAAATKTEEELFDAVEERLSENLYDLPFTLTYLFDEDGTTARLAAASGIEDTHPAAASRLDLSQTRWPLQEIEGGAAPRVVDAAALFGELPSGAWEKPPQHVMLVPLAQQGAERSAAGFFIAGINPYRAIDAAYTGFIEMLAGQIAAALASARAFEEERKRAEALEEIDRAKTAFFSNVSHEFRTPLTLMLGPLEDLLAAPAPTGEQVHAQVELAHRNGLRLLRLVNSLLDFSRIEAGRVKACFRPTDLAAFSSEIASSFRSAVEKAGLALEIKAEPLPGRVYLDREMWEKILLNLLSNAFKFTFEGRISVRTRPSEDGRSAVVQVRDTGIGVPPEELPHLFERFHRVEGARGRSFEGSGIGLALVQELVKLHGGSISAESTPGEGSAFTIVVPVGKAHLPAEQVSEEEGEGEAMATSAQPFLEEALRWAPAAVTGLGAATTAAVGAPAAAAGAGKRIVLADDNADMREYVARLLRSQGYEVEAVADGRRALDAARAAPPDLILSDVMMPHLDGFGLIAEVRRSPDLAGTPVILLSARAGEEAKVEGLDAGADDYLVKPFAARELLARVNANVQMAAIRREAARAVMASEQRFQMTQERLSRALATGRVAVYDWKVDEDRLSVLGPLSEVFGVTMEEAAQGLPLQRFVEGIHAEDRDATMAKVQATVQTGEPFEAEYRVGRGEVRWVLSRGQMGVSPDGRPVFSGVLIDLTHDKVHREVLEEQTRALQILNRAAAAIAGDLDQERVVQSIIDAGVELTQAAFGAFFYNVSDEAGERYTLYTLSGAPRSAFETFPMPRNTAIFHPTFAGEGVVRSDDITKDLRYGKSAPYHGMPKGHLPVRSYLAVPVRSRTGEVLGGLFFGHPEPGVFSARAEELMQGLAAQAAVALDNVELFRSAQRELEQRRRAEAELQAMNATLEQRVAAEVEARTKVEEALRQAQKMEAIGQLTGGVAHDFNNLLTVIIGGLDTIRRSKPEDEARIRRATDMALQGAQRAASLTGRLLAFSRRQPLDPRPIDLNGLVRDMTDLLHRTLGETIELEGVLAPRLWRVEVDQNQLESAIINLAVNARDAMPEGGKLTIETANTALDESYSATDAEVIPGQYVMVAVSDTGFGMSKDILSRAFEPFYTTKEVGKGTGLGLSMVYGFVKQSGGHVTIYSEEGQGTTVKLYFPRFRGGAERPDELKERAAPGASAGEVVLLVEDNDDVRNYSAMILSELGYSVLEAADAEEALAILDQAPRIDLLFTDVVLPGRTGRVLADEVQARRPGMPVLYTTGYSRNAIVHHGRLDPGVQLITKPFTFEELAVRVRDILDRR